MNKLLTIIVPRNDGEKVVNAAKLSGAGGASILRGRGTAQNQILEIMGLVDTQKDIVYILCNNSQYEGIKQAIIQHTPHNKKSYGILYTTTITAFVKNNEQITQGEDSSMNTETKNQLITVILNAGYADDAMAAARKAGAKGGTIINARGTGKDEDATFFGISIVPEKEILLLIVPTEQTTEILNAIKNLPYLQEKGSGIAYCSPVSDFINLGNNA